MMTDKTFTLAQVARDMKLDPKYARRKTRAEAAKENGVKLPATVKSPGRKNIRYEWPDTKANRAAVEAFLK